MYIMLCMRRQSNNCTCEASRYLLNVTGKNATANELQYLSNKINKQINKQTNRNIYIKIDFQNSIEKLSILCRITDIKIAWINPWLLFIEKQMQLL